MLTDERPATWHDDDYIREWARQRGLSQYPVARVPLISTLPGLHEAKVHFGAPDAYVTRHMEHGPAVRTGAAHE